MNIKDMKKEELESILEALMKQGKIMEVDVVAVANPAPSEDMKAVCDMIHGLLCSKIHGDKAEDCDYYIEDNLFEGWSLPTHRIWLQEVGKLMKDYNIASVSDLTHALRAVASLVKSLSDVRMISIDRYRLVATIIYGYLSRELKRLTPQSEDVDPEYPLA